jgi:hypothetical protein
VQRGILFDYGASATYVDVCEGNCSTKTKTNHHCYADICIHQQQYLECLMCMHDNCCNNLNDNCSNNFYCRFLLSIARKW